MNLVKKLGDFDIKKIIFLLVLGILLLLIKRYRVNPFILVLFAISISILSLQYIRFFNIHIGIELYTFSTVFISYYTNNILLGFIVGIFGMCLAELSVNKFSPDSILLGALLGFQSVVVIFLKDIFPFSIIGLIITVINNILIITTLFFLNGRIVPNHLLYVSVNLVFNFVLFSTVIPIIKTIIFK
ncbi:hypothetical protein GF327_07590 [Candidatus Woesearchaeota archaeon]|nr:hypothetical protein [Candidatus Woesearchaeota archaeon]